MSDPYNTAGSQPSAQPGTTPAAIPARPALPRRTSRKPDSTASAISGLLPVWNVLALVLGLGWIGAKGGVPASSVVWFYGPLILAVISSYWIRSQGLATTVRVLNALLAAFVLFKLLRYARMGMFGASMLVLFVTAALVPILNAIYLKPRSVD